MSSARAQFWHEIHEGCEISPDLLQSKCDLRCDTAEIDVYEQKVTFKVESESNICLMLVAVISGHRASIHDLPKGLRNDSHPL